MEGVPDSYNLCEILVAIVFGLENPTFFWPKVTLEFLNIARGEVGSPPVLEIFLECFP